MSSTFGPENIWANILNRIISNKFEQPPNHVSSSPSSNTPSPPLPPPPSLVDTPNPVSVASSNSSVPTKKIAELPSIPLVLVRSRSDGDIDSFSLEKLRREEIIGEVSKQRLTRTTTNVAICRSQKVANANGNKVVEARDSEEAGHSKRNNSAKVEDQRVGTFFLIKNLDTGKEFIVNEYGENGVWNKLSELQTGKQISFVFWSKC
ncbi:hypothetical protein RJT34_27501 [Clitoria ternatea]|uniref:Uncharacterized protein n=1 Tax=Clitoria ternatea TaxID=43366 RepID=A0AAN9F7S4_CLITE